MSQPKTAIRIIRLDDGQPGALLHHYPQTISPQPTHLSLDLEDGELSADYNPEIGDSVPASVFHHRTIWFAIPILTAKAANQLMEDVAPVAQRILDGSTVEWDNQRGARVGRLNNDAYTAMGELEDMCAAMNFDDRDIVTEYDAGDWFGGEGRAAVIERLSITGETTDERIAELARDEEEAAHQAGDAGHTVLRGAEEYLTGLRDELRQEVRYTLADVAGEMAKLKNRRDQMIRRIRAWNVDSDRAIGALAGISHTSVQNIAGAATYTGGDDD